MTTPTPPPVTINPRVLQAQYAVRGLLPTRALEIENEIKAGKPYPFQKLIYCNIGNPQALQQPPLTFPRQVMALVDCPSLLQNPPEALHALFPPDALTRARDYLSGPIGARTGAYTHSLGYDGVRTEIAHFISARDSSGDQPDKNHIFLTDGASAGVKLVLQCLVSDPSDGVMIPIPQYPLYTASLALLGGTAVDYYLQESSGWSVEVGEMERIYEASVRRGVTPRVLVVINPGNPTGQVLEVGVMEGCVRFAHRHGLVVLADEVYQENVYCKPGKGFHSFREVTLGMGAPYAQETMVASLHSTSKGILGECGRRGGYMELLNFPSELYAQIMKLASINLCSNVNGQLMTELMVRPPQPGEASYESYTKEYTTIYDSLVRRAALLVRELNAIPGIRSNEIEGAMYAFPQLMLPQSFIDYNARENERNGTSMQPDVRWCLQLLEATGIVVVPGSGFGQREGTYHFRTTILPPEEDMVLLTKSLRVFQGDFLKRFS